MHLISQRRRCALPFSSSVHPFIRSSVHPFSFASWNDTTALLLECRPYSSRTTTSSISYKPFLSTKTAARKMKCFFKRRKEEGQLACSANDSVNRWLWNHHGPALIKCVTPSQTPLVTPMVMRSSSSSSSSDGTTFVILWNWVAFCMCVLFPLLFLRGASTQRLAPCCWHETIGENVT